MAVVEHNLRYQVKIDYKETYDTTGELDLANWQQTFSYVSEEATDQQLYDYVKALAALTVYSSVPYRIQKVTTGTLSVA